MVEVNVDFMIEAMKCHKDDKHDVKGLDTEVNKHYLNSQFVFPVGFCFCSSLISNSLYSSKFSLRYKANKFAFRIFLHCKKEFYIGVHTTS